MPEIRGFIAATVDGYIADSDGGIDWLSDFAELDYGYDAFIAQIETVVLGRRTYDQVRELLGWPYKGERTVVVTHRPVDDPPPLAETWGGEIGALAGRLRADASGDIWVVGGSSVQQQFLEADGLDRLEIHLIPRLLGDGIPLWPRSERMRRLSLNEVQRMEGGMVRLEYTLVR